MPILKTNAIPLYFTNVSNTSRIVTWMTARYGKLSTIIKGEQRKNSLFRGQYDLFSTSELLFYDRAEKEIHIAKECSMLTRRTAFRTDWRACASAGYISALFAKTTLRHGHEPDRFEFFEEMLSLAETCGRHPAFLVWFDLQFAEFQGQAVQLNYREPRSEIRGQRAEDREQRSEVGGQRTEDRGQRLETGDQNSEIRVQRTHIPHSTVHIPHPAPPVFPLSTAGSSTRATRGNIASRPRRLRRKPSPYSKLGRKPRPQRAYLPPTTTQPTSLRSNVFSKNLSAGSSTCRRTSVKKRSKPSAPRRTENSRLRSEVRDRRSEVKEH